MIMKARLLPCFLLAASLGLNEAVIRPERYLGKPSALSPSLDPSFSWITPSHQLPPRRPNWTYCVYNYEEGRGRHAGQPARKPGPYFQYSLSSAVTHHAGLEQLSLSLSLCLSCWIIIPSFLPSFRRPPSLFIIDSTKLGATDSEKGACARMKS